MHFLRTQAQLSPASGLVSHWLAAVVILVICGRAWSQPGAGGQPDPLLTLMLSQPSIVVSGPIQVTNEFDPPVVAEGDLAVYRVTFIAIQESIEWPETVPAPQQLNLREGARDQLLVPAGTNIEARTTFLYRARPSEPGLFTIPEFQVPVYGRPTRVPAAHLRVLPRGSKSASAAPTLRLEVPSTNVFVGQGVRAKVMLPFTAPSSQSLSQVRLVGAEGQGFLVDQSAVRQRIEPVPIGGTNQITYIFETLVTPISPGRITFYAQGWSTINRVTGPVYITNNMVMNLVTTHLLLDSEPVELSVKPLPQEGRLPGFSGAVGIFTNDPPILSTNIVRAGDPIKMKVTFRGQGNIARLVPPPVPRSEQWQVFEASGDPTAPQMIHAQGAITFTYTLIPLVPDLEKTPPLPFSTFDPRAQRYVDQTVQPARIRVVATDAPIDIGAFAAANESAPSMTAPLALSGLAISPGRTAASLEPIQSRSWFPIAQAAPAVVFLTLFLWDKRRRYLLSHPEVVLRARGLKSMRRYRRNMRRSWEQRDATGFGEAAIGALRAGSSPHYPALPRALVGKDVIEVLPAQARNGPAGKAVRHLFRTEYAAHYAASSQDLDDLLSLRDQLDQALDALERQLRSRHTSSFDFLLKPASVTALSMLWMASIASADMMSDWRAGTNAFIVGEYEAAAAGFRSVAASAPASGALQNLGLAEWHSGNTGFAILAWEQALWLDPFNRAAAQNLAFARHAAQLVSPDLAWFEVPSQWLPPNWWPWFTGVGLWLAVGAILLPGIFGDGRASWQQALAALGFTIFLVCIPAQVGVQTRTKIGFILEKNTPLRLTPTRNAQTIQHLAAGEPARVRRQRGDYLFVRTAGASGWVLKSALGLVADPASVMQKPSGENNPSAEKS